MSRGNSRGGKADHLVNSLGSMDGARVEGGCDYCSAYQVMRTVGGGVFELKVFHDYDCPVLLKVEGRK
jgi:hypothetical protein